MSNPVRHETAAQEAADRIDTELAAAIDRFVRKHPKSLALFERARASMPGGNTRSALHFDPFPLYVEKSHGVHLDDVDGHRYLDVLGEYTAGLFGHSNETIRAAAIEAFAIGHSNGAPGAAEVHLAELLRARFPNVERLRFCNSGTEANLYAVTLARAATGRQRLLGFTGGYHGGVFVFANGGSPMNAPFDWTLERFNDLDAVELAFERNRGQFAAVLVEPMLTNGGCIPARPEFLELLRRRCTEDGSLLIFDEVVTSRMGDGGAQKLFGVTPDLTTFGKYIGAGFSAGAFGGRKEIMDLLDPTRPDALPHAGTFNNNVFSMAAGFAALDKEFTPERALALHRTGEELRHRLNEIASEAAVAVQFTGLGSVMNIHFHTGDIRSPSDLYDEDRRLFRLFHFDLLEAGVYAAARGQINLSLPMTIEDHSTIVGGVADFIRKRKALLQGLA